MEISRHVSVGAIAVLVLDGAGWHTSPRVDLPDNIVLLPLPAYAPELNPMENLWAFLRANFLSHQNLARLRRDPRRLPARLEYLMQLPDRIASITQARLGRTCHR